jgi:uncharacterized protein (TIGR02600 family)
MNYLALLTGYQMPSTSNVVTGASTSASLKDKYNKDNMNTILVEIFDYIRSTNLYDDLLSSKNAQTTTTGKSETQTYTDAPAEFYTYTNPLRYNNRTSDNGGNPVTPRIVADDGWPGHGTVSPSIWSVGSTKYRGMGRFITISEIGIQFICTADGGNGSGKEIEDGQYGPINGVYSGGRSVERIDPNVTDLYRNEGASVAYAYFSSDRVPQNGDKARWWSNFPPKPLKDQYGTKVAKYLQRNASDNPNNHPGYDPMNWNCTLDPSIALGANQKRIQALVDVEFFCPSEGWTLLNPEWTIVLGTPGQDNPISGIKVNNIPLWSTANKVYVIKSNKNIFSVSSSVGRSGGSVSPTAIYNGRRVGGNQNLPKDVGYDDSGNATASGHLGLDNCDLASGFATITAPANNQTMTIQFTNPSGLPISLYDTHNWQSAQPVQTFTVNLAQGGSTITAPVPQLITQSTNKRTYTTGGVRHIQRAVDAPHFWCFQYSGALGRYQSSGIITPLNVNGGAYAVAIGESNLSTRLGGRFRLENDATTIQAQGGEFNSITNNTNATLPASNAIIYTMSTPGLFDTKSGKTYEQLFGSDVVRSVTPCGGDYRIVASLYNVPANAWMPHRNWNARFTNAGGQQSWYYNCHNFCSRNSDDAGFDTNLNTSSIPNAPQFVRAYPANSFANMGAKMPDIPQADVGGSTTSALDALNSFLDFDNDQGDGRDGAFCNKPDEGNFSALNYQFSVGEKTYRNGYFYTSYEMEPDKTTTNAYFTPNRLISSPVMFGSLVTTTFDSPSQYQAHGYTGTGRPWQTLLFRPHVTPTSAGSSAAQFAGSIIPVTGATYLANHPGAQNPPDHYLLDLFTMPVVEPYAISEPLSTAGKINLNYQIVPFTYIRRATAVYAAMKGELMRAISISDNGNRSNPLTTAYTYKNAVTAASGQTLPVFPPMYFWSETGSKVSAQQPAVNNHYWHRRIDPAETTKQLDERFLINTALPDRRKGLLRSASQVCELHMIPANPPTVPTGMYIMPGPSSIATRETNMQKFWSVHALTGDNTREEIYSHLYPKFTTRSNTFRVHVRAQALKKSRSTSPTTFNTAEGDKVLSEYRGSYLLERYIDPNDSTILLPNYAGGGDPMNAPSLENFYRFHILEVKRFAP